MGSDNEIYIVRLVIVAIIILFFLSLLGSGTVRLSPEQQNEEAIGCGDNRTFYGGIFVGTSTYTHEIMNIPANKKFFQKTCEQYFAQYPPVTYNIHNSGCEAYLNNVPPPGAACGVIYCSFNPPSGFLQCEIDSVVPKCVELSRTEKITYKFSKNILTGAQTLTCIFTAKSDVQLQKLVSCSTCAPV